MHFSASNFGTVHGKGHTHCEELFQIGLGRVATCDVDEDFSILGMGRSYPSLLVCWIQEWFWVTLPEGTYFDGSLADLVPDT